MFKFGIIDGIIKEPLGGAHSAPEEMVEILKKQILKTIKELKKQPTEKLIENRINKYASIGVYEKEAQEAAVRG